MLCLYVLVIYCIVYNRVAAFASVAISLLFLSLQFPQRIQIAKRIVGRLFFGRLFRLRCFHLVRRRNAAYRK